MEKSAPLILSVKRQKKVHWKAVYALQNTRQVKMCMEFVTSQVKVLKTENDFSLNLEYYF